MATMYDLPAEALRLVVDACKSTQDKSQAGALPTASQTRSVMLSLSETNQALRSIALPYLWQHAGVSISFDRLSEANRCLKELSNPTHPLHRYAKDLDVHIDSQLVPLNRAMTESLDGRLASVIANAPALESVKFNARSSYDWSSTTQAILGCVNLADLAIRAVGNIWLQPFTPSGITKLAVNVEVGSVSLDLTQFPHLKHLSLVMDDHSSYQSWSHLAFPPALWTHLQSFHMAGFSVDPLALLSRMLESLDQTQTNVKALQSLSYHIARDEQDATLALQCFEQLPLRKLSFTVPFLFDARYARSIARACPQLEDLDLFAFSRAAAWQWPEPIAAYGNALAEIQGLKSLRINHNELPVSPLPLSLPNALDLPQLQLLNTSPAGAAAADTPEATVNLLPDSMSTSEDGISVATSPSAAQEDIIGDSEQEQLIYGPSGAFFCSAVSPEQISQRKQIVTVLAAKMPSLQTVYFEPSDEQAGRCTARHPGASHTNPVEDQKLEDSGSSCRFRIRRA